MDRERARVVACRAPIRAKCPALPIHPKYHMYWTVHTVVVPLRRNAQRNHCSVRYLCRVLYLRPRAYSARVLYDSSLSSHRPLLTGTVLRSALHRKLQRSTAQIAAYLRRVMRYRLLGFDHRYHSIVGLRATDCKGSSSLWPCLEVPFFLLLLVPSSPILLLWRTWLISLLLSCRIPPFSPTVPLKRQKVLSGGTGYSQ